MFPELAMGFLNNLYNTLSVKKVEGLCEDKQQWFV